MTDKLRDDLTRDLNALRAAASRGPVSSRDIFQMTDGMMDRLSRAALAAAPQPAPETMAWAVVRDDGHLKVGTTSRLKCSPHALFPGDRIVRVAIRVVDGGDV